MQYQSSKLINYTNITIINVNVPQTGSCKKIIETKAEKQKKKKTTTLTHKQRTCLANMLWIR